MHWRALTQEPAPRCRRLLFHLHSGPASQAAGAPPTALHAASSSLPSSIFSSAALSHPRGNVPFLSTFCCFLISRRFLISSQPTCLSLLLLASAALGTEHKHGRRGEGTVGPDQTPLCSLHTHALANRAMRWAEPYRRLKMVIILLVQYDQKNQNNNNKKKQNQKTPKHKTF